MAGLIRWCPPLAVALLTLAATLRPAVATDAPTRPIPVILDTDMLGDVDDVGAVAVLHALADSGEARILGMGVSTPDPWSGRCLAALNTYFGRADLPLGLLRGQGFARKKSRYTRQIAEEFPGGGPLDGTAGQAAPDAFALYRRLLAAADDGTVVVVSVGYLDNLALLLESPPDDASPLSGRDLVSRKVRAWVCMGGRFPAGEEACNFRRSPASAARVLADWPTEAVFIGGELGDPIGTGKGLQSLPADSPVRRAFELYNGITDRSSWDQAAVLHAVRGLAGGLDDFWSLRGGGRVSFDPATAAVSWQEAADGRHGYLVARRPPEEIAAVIERLMSHQPKPAVARPLTSVEPQPDATANPPPLPFVAGSETLVVLPDTEGYAGRRPQIFNAMLQWVADERERRAIRSLLHVGDVTNSNTPGEWANARAAFDLIEGKVPYVLAAGNHDYDGQPDRRTLMNDVFKVEDLRKWPSFGGVFEEGRLENHFQLLEIHGRPWIVLSLEMGPRKGVIAWADKVLADHPDRLAIILTHAYLFYDNQRFDHRRGPQRATPHNFFGEGADGEMLWESLVARHPNVMLVICGHVANAYLGYRKDEGVHGNVVHQMMVDYEKMRGGMGFLRLLEFLPDRKTVQVRTYSPVTKGTNPINPALEEFQFELVPAPDRAPARP